MNVLEVVLLLANLGALWAFVREDAAEYASFKLLAETRARQQRFRVWVGKSFTLFFGGAAVSLGALGRVGAITHLPSEFAGLSQRVQGVVPTGLALNRGFLIGLLIPAVAAVAIAAVAARRGKRPSKPAAMVGDIGSLLPRNGRESLHLVMLALNAGVGEELYFRLLLPLLMILVFGHAVWVFVGAAVLFGLVHAYQGAAGVAATTIVGLVMTGLYLGSGSLVLPMGVHTLIDLLNLVVRPTVGRWLASGRAEEQVGRR